MVNNWLKNVHAKVFTSTCLLCGQCGHFDINLCEACFQELPWLTTACKKCGLPLSVENPALPVKQRTCGQCLRKPPPFDQCHCLFYYDHPIDRLISGLKFHQKLSYGKTLGKLLASDILKHYSHTELPDALVAVPLHKSRLRERGFNQAYEIARSCSNTLGIPLFTNVCQRIKNTPHQLGLDAKTRRKNLRAAFKVDSIESTLNIRSVALIDDVMTTGSTLSELTKSFSTNDIQYVHIWCIARTVIS